MIDRDHGEEFRDLDLIGVVDIDDVVVAHRKLARREEAGGIAEIDAEDRRDVLPVAGELLRVDAHLLQRRPLFDPVDEDLSRLRAVVDKATGFADGVAERHGLLQELELSARARRAEGHEGALILIDVQRIARRDEDVLARVPHEIDEIDCALEAVTLQRDEFFVTGIADAAGARNRVEHTVAGRVDRDLAGRADVADDGDLGRRLRDDGDDRLRVDRAILQLVDDVLLDGGSSTVQRTNLSGVGNGDVALASTV